MTEHIYDRTGAMELTLKHLKPTVSAGDKFPIHLLIIPNKAVEKEILYWRCRLNNNNVGKIRVSNRNCTVGKTYNISP